MTVTQQVYEAASQWIPRLASLWSEETPLRIHSGSLADDGTYDWHPDFVAWLMGTRENSVQRTRLTSAMRRLRKAAVREFEVAYRIIVSGESLEQACAWLNERAERNGLPDRYSLRDTQVILISAIDKLVAWS